MQRPYDDLMDARVPECLYDFSSPHAYLAARGVTGVPTVAVGDDLLWGDDQLEAVAARMEAQ